MMPPPNTSIYPSIDISLLIGAIVVAPNGQVEGKIDEAVIDSVTGKVRYFIVTTGDRIRGRASIYALPVGDCQFDEKGKSCVAMTLYPLRA